MKTYTKEVTKPKLEILLSGAPDSPRTWSNLGKLIVISRSRYSPDKDEVLESIVNNFGDVAKNLAHHIRLVKEVAKLRGVNILWILPVNTYEHGNISMSIGEKFGFDYSNNGFYIVTEETYKEVMGGTNYPEEPDAKALESIQSELDTYCKWANGEVYSFLLYNDEGELEDSCCGFYDIEDIKEHLPEEWADEDLTEYVK